MLLLPCNNNSWTKIILPQQIGLIISTQHTETLVDLLGYRQAVHPGCLCAVSGLICHRENAFLLEERDLLSQQLASEARNPTPAQRQISTCPSTPLSFLPFVTPVAPATLGTAAATSKTHDTQCTTSKFCNVASCIRPRFAWRRHTALHTLQRRLYTFLDNRSTTPYCHTPTCG